MEDLGSTIPKPRDDDQEDCHVQKKVDYIAEGVKVVDVEVTFKNHLRAREPFLSILNRQFTFSRIIGAMSMK